MPDPAAEAHVEDPEGLLIDALVLLIADAKARKAANSESTSDVRATEAETLIRRLTSGWVLAREQDTATQPSEHPGDPHRFITRCVVCQKEGRLVISLITDDEQVRTEPRDD